MKSVLLYLLLVGLPVLGVSAVLKAGRSITPPVSFGGDWEVEVWPDSLCHRGQISDTLLMTVEQSGPKLDLSFSKGVHLTGRVVQNAFRAAGRDRVRLHGTMRSDTTRYQFDGFITGAPCPAARVSRVTATRIRRVSQSAGH